MGSFCQNEKPMGAAQTTRQLRTRSEALDQIDVHGQRLRHSASIVTPAPASTLLRFSAAPSDPADHSEAVYPSLSSSKRAAREQDNVLMGGKLEEVVLVAAHAHGLPRISAGSRGEGVARWRYAAARERQTRSNRRRKMARSLPSSIGVRMRSDSIVLPGTPVLIMESEVSGDWSVMIAAACSSEGNDLKIRPRVATLYETC